MATFGGGWGVPGVGGEFTVTEREILWGGDQTRIGALWMNAVYSGTARDAGNTPTTVLRSGLIMGRNDSTGELEEWDFDATDGTQNIAGILDVELKATDYFANNADRVFRTLVRGPVKARMLLVEGSALVGHAAEFLARRQLREAGFILDDDPFGYLAGAGNRISAKTANYTVRESDNGTLFTNKGATGAVTFTLPATAKRGLEYTFYVVADQNVTITAGTVGTLVVQDNAAADSLAINTADELIGTGIRVVGDGALWYAMPYQWHVHGEDA